MEETTGAGSSPRTAALACGLLLLAGLALSISSGFDKSPSADENRYAGFGKYLLRTADYENFLLLDQPPLPYWIVSIPFLFVDTPPAAGDVVVEKYHSSLSRAFLFENTIPPRTVLLLGRTTVGVCFVLLGALIGWFAGRRYGPWGAVVAVGLTALGPNFIAHSRQMTSDIISALFFVTGAAVWATVLVRPGVRKGLGGGAALGLVLLSKVTMVLFLPGLAVAALARLLFQGGGARWAWLRRAVPAGIVALLAASVLIFAAYGFTVDPVIPDHSEMLKEKLWHDHWQGTARKLLTEAPVPAPAYARMVMFVGRHANREKTGYMDGRLYRNGDPLFYPYCLAVKLPLGSLLLLLALLGSFLARPPDAWEGTLLCISGTFFLFAVTARVNIGVRHVLPVTAVLFLLAGRIPAVFSRRGFKIAVVAALAFNAVSTVRAWPHYLAYFNEAAGGPASGHLRLADSNLDWGQDLIGLKEFMEERGIGKVRLSYFGAGGMPDRYGIAREPVETDDRMGERTLAELARMNPGWVAISATNLKNLYRHQHGDMSWAERFEPVARIGHTIFIYHLDPADHGGEDDGGD